MNKQPFETAVKEWMIDNGYITEKYRLKIISKEIIGKSDWAEIACEVYKPRKRKPFYISFKYNFVREQIKTDTIEVNGLN